jgi:hypothetical protein
MVFFVCLTLLRWGGESLYAAPNGLSIENVNIDNVTLSPGGEVNISFLLTEDARVTVLIYDPDYAMVRTLLNGQNRQRGTVTTSWDGRDDSGTMLPDEAYLISIVAEGSGGQSVVFDPTVDSGGEVVDVIADRIEEVNGGYEIRYSVPAPSRVSMRAGIHDGTLLKTLLDWVPLPPGNYVETWDGTDDTGRIQVMDRPDSVLEIRAFSLPRGTIIISGSSGDYFKYHRSLKSGSVAGKSGAISYTSVRKNALQRKGRRISQQYLVPRILNVSPSFTVYLDGDKSAPLADAPVPTVSGRIGLLIEVSPESLYSFNESRYEMVVYIDDKRFDEEEQAYSPYSYPLDTTSLLNGEHWISINLASITGQVGSYSFKINVNN